MIRHPAFCHSTPKFPGVYALTLRRSGWEVEIIALLVLDKFQGFVWICHILRQEMHSTRLKFQKDEVRCPTAMEMMVFCAVCFKGIRGFMRLSIKIKEAYPYF